MEPERRGTPVVGALTAGRCHGSAQPIPLVAQALKRMWPDAVAGDMGDSASALRDWLAEREIEAAIPKRTDKGEPNDADREAVRGHRMIERTSNRRKRFRRIATRYAQRASSDLAPVTIACSLGTRTPATPQNARKRGRCKKW